jgi:two-component SAPR family response regulator
MLIFTNSDALAEDIKFELKDKYGSLVSCSTLSGLKEHFGKKDVELLIADMDIDEDTQEEILRGLKACEESEVSCLFLSSEKQKLEFEKKAEMISSLPLASEWLIKPFSRDALISSVNRLSENIKIK